MSTTMTLPPPPASFTKDSNVVLGLGGYFHQKRVEPVGRSFHRRAKNVMRGRSASCDEEDEDAKTRKAIKKQEESILRKYRKFIKGKSFVDLTMYEQLGLKDVGFNATEDQIKKAYHRVLIEHHPDKTGKTENDPNYLAVQKAFATLTDPAKKRAYDSLCDFDEWIPSGKEKIKQNDKDSDSKAKCFYELYGPVFERNARFSMETPVPLLGDDTKDIDEVYAFYDFWQKFDSWREFTHDAEHDLEGAGDRDHKRWMAKKNDVVAKKKKKAEYARLTNLVDRAMANDPRIKRVKQMQKQKKEDEKRRKEEEIRRAAEEEARIQAEAERLVREKEEKEKAERMNSKMAKEKMKKLHRKVKKAFRELMAAAEEQGAEGAIDISQTEDICDALPMAELQEVVAAMGGSVDKMDTTGLSKVAEVIARI